MLASLAQAADNIKRLHLKKVERNPNVSFDFHMYVCCGSSCMPTLTHTNVHTHIYINHRHTIYTLKDYKTWPYDLANPHTGYVPKGNEISIPERDSMLMLSSALVTAL